MTEKTTPYIVGNIYTNIFRKKPAMLDGDVLPYGADIPYQPGKISASIIDLETYRSNTSGKPDKS